MSNQSRSIRVKMHQLLSLMHNLQTLSVLILPSSQTKIWTISRLLSKRGQKSQSSSCQKHNTTLLWDRLLSQQIFSPAEIEGKELGCTCAQKGVKYAFLFDVGYQSRVNLQVAPTEYDHERDSSPVLNTSTCA